MVSRATLLCALALAACAQSPESLAPFPCSTEGVCPTQDPATTSHDSMLRCVEGQCQRHELLLPCDVDDDCPQSPASVCHPLLKRCVKASCAGVSDFTQMADSCWPRCSAGSDCHAGESCQDLGWQSICVKDGFGLDAPCTTSADCALGTAVSCVSGRCTRVCTSGSDCRSGEECAKATPSSSSGVCGTRCSGGRACPANTTCTVTGEGGDSLWCLSPGVGPGRTCGNAPAGTPCGGPLFCGDPSSPRCWSACQYNQGTCTTGFYCSDYTRQGWCHPACGSGSSCPGGMSCKTAGALDYACY